MSKTILYIALSLDGFIAGPNDDLSFLNEFNNNQSEVSENTSLSFEDFFANIGSIILGKRTYDLEESNGWGMAHPVPKFILTTDTQKPDGARKDTVFTHEPIEMILEKAKAAAGSKDVWVEGGANVVQQYINAKLIDELQLFFVPVLLGNGIKLFDNLESKVGLTLLETNQNFGGLVELKYRVHK
jgi:dihydrofolate reductase